MAEFQILLVESHIGVSTKLNLVEGPFGVSVSRIPNSARLDFV